MKTSTHRGETIRGWSASGDLFGSLLAGLLIGLGLDALLGTSPFFVVVLIIVGAVGAFIKANAESEAKIDELAREALRIRRGA